MRIHAPLVPLLFAAAAAAQADILYSNISSTAGEYKDCITLFSGGKNRPLVQESTVRTGTGSSRKMLYRAVGGKNYLYWYDIIPDDLYRATDQNGNGALDPSEFQVVFDFDASSQGHVAEQAGVFWTVVGQGTGAHRGLWKHIDGNADGDFMDAGESVQLVSGGAIAYGATTALATDQRACAVLKNGDCIWYAAHGPSWFRTTPTGQHSLWLAYRAVAAGSITPPPAPNPDFGTALPAIPTDPMDRVAVDANGIVYLAPNFSATAGKNYIFRCEDKNANGDVMDAGEVTLFYDGVLSTPKWGPIDDIEYFAGAIYVSYEIDTALDPGCQFLSLRDLNNDGDAMDAGEVTAIGRTATTDDPTVIGITAVPQGLFGPSCVNLDLRNSATITSTAAGSITFTMGDIPANQLNDSTNGYAFLSLTGTAGLLVPISPYTCTIGITPDALFGASVGLLTGGPFTIVTQGMGVLPYPAGIPIGTKLYFAGMSVRMSDFSLRGITQSGLIEVKI